ncbi:amino acid permease, partial [Ureaplasma urealyticum]
LQHKIKNAKKNVPITLVVGMFLVAIVYILITIGQVFTSEGYAYGVINKVFEYNANLVRIITIVINVFITISIIGVLNSFVIFLIHNGQYAIDEKIVFWWSWLQRVKSKHFKEMQGLVSVLIVFFVWIIIFMIISIPLNTDVYIDLLSNYPIVFFFA